MIVPLWDDSDHSTHSDGGQLCSSNCHMQYVIIYHRIESSVPCFVWQCNSYLRNSNSHLYCSPVTDSAPTPIGLRILFSKSSFFVWNAYSSLCTFVIKYDGADKLYSVAPFSKFLDVPLLLTAVRCKVPLQRSPLCHCNQYICRNNNTIILLLLLLLQVAFMCGCSYLRQIVNETLRWAVVGPYAARVQHEDTVIAGHHIPAGVCLCGLGRKQLFVVQKYLLLSRPKSNCSVSVLS